MKNWNIGGNYETDVIYECSERTAQERQADNDKVNQLKKLIGDHRRKKFWNDYKTLAYLSCVAGVIVGAIVVIILAAMGIISMDSDQWFLEKQLVLLDTAENHCFSGASLVTAFSIWKTLDLV